MLRTRVIEDARQLEDLVPAWDDLARKQRLPYCSAAWMLEWWRCVGPPRARLLAVVVEEDELVAIAPFWWDAAARRPRRLRLLGSGASTRREPLFERSRAGESAEAIAQQLADLHDSFDIIELEGVVASSSSAFVEAIRDAWPARRPELSVERRQAAPILHLAGRTFEEWMASRSSNFRQQMRKSKRDLIRKGATFRMSSKADLERDLASFARLHHARWQDRGGSYGLNESVESMLLHASRVLVSDGRFRLWCTDVEGATISAHIFLAAGGEVTYWLGGFDDEWSSFRPSLVTILAAIEDAWSRGDERVDLGVGDQDYKRRFTDAEDDLIWPLLVPRGRRYPLTKATLAAKGAGRKLASRLTPERRAKLKRLLRR